MITYGVDLRPAVIARPARGTGRLAPSRPSETWPSPLGFDTEVQAAAS
jgi:hypothetical protein